MKAYQYNLLNELIVDNFAGGGGASTGIELAIGRIVDIAVNHDKAAIEMHQKNHPYTKHYCEDVWQIRPIEVTQGRSVALAWFSPDCKHFSKAKGSTPVSKNIRGLAWVAIRWAATVKPRVIILENVEEFMTWGPVKDGKPIKEKEGQTFRSFVKNLELRGYKVDWKILKACDYGAPTSRKRFFLIARCDGKPIVFPKPTHGKGLKPYRTASECIDWTLPYKSIFERKKTLAENTLKRIARGLEKFVLKEQTPFIMQMNFDNPPQDVNAPLSTITAINKHYVTMPTITPFIVSNNTGNVPHSIMEPLPTITTGNRNYVVAPYIVPIGYGENKGQKPRVHDIQKPLSTIVSTVKQNLCTPYLVKYYSGGGHFQDIRKPMPTITTKDRIAVSIPYITIFRNNMDAQSVRTPLRTVTSKALHHALTNVCLQKLTCRENDLGYWNKIRELLNQHLGYAILEDEILIIEFNGVQYFISDIGMRMLEPKELAMAQGFPEDYILQVSSSYSKSAQVARIGNSVCPVMAKVLVQSNLPELCTQDIRNMAMLDEILTSPIKKKRSSHTHV